MSAPRCHRHGQPIFCQRKGFVWINGLRLPKWICPVCHGWFTVQKTFRAW